MIDSYIRVISGVGGIYFGFWDGFVKDESVFMAAWHLLLGMIS